MKNKRLLISFSIIILVVLLAFSGIAVNKTNRNSKVTQDPKEKIKSLLSKSTAIPVSNTEEINIKKPVEKDPDISNVVIPGDVIASIKNSDYKNFDKNVLNYKKVLVRLNVPKEFRIKLEDLIKNGKKVQHILPVYNFLYDNYGTIDELEAMVDKLESGTTLADIIMEYNSSHPEFVPSKFEETYLDKLLKTMTIDDIMIADRLSQKGLAKFEDLIAKRQSGMSWSSINAELGIINMSDQLPRMSLTQGQVNKCMQDTGFDEKEATKVLVLTWKTGKEYSEVKQELKSGKKQEEIYADSYNQKYK